MDWSQVFDTDVVGEWLRTSGVRILITIVAAIVATRAAASITRRLEKHFEDDDPTFMSEREKEVATFGKIIRNAARVIIWGVAVLMVLKEAGIEIGPILAGVGIAGLAVGFGAQTLVKDLIAGIFVLGENHYNVGDVIRVAGVAGLVEKITLRATTLRDLHGQVHIIPNGTIDVVTNMTKKWSRAVLDIGVAYKEDVDAVIEILKEVGAELENDKELGRFINFPLEVLGVDDLADSAVVIRVMFTTQPGKQWTIARDFRRRIKKAFDEKGVEIPFPHTTVYLGDGSPMDGRLQVELTGPTDRASRGDAADPDSRT